MVTEFDAVEDTEVLLAAVAEQEVARLVASLENSDSFKEFARRIRCIRAGAGPDDLGRRRGPGSDDDPWCWGVDVLNLLAWQVQDARPQLRLEGEPLHVAEGSVVFGGRLRGDAVVVKLKLADDTHNTLEAVQDAERALRAAGLHGGRLEVLDHFTTSLARALVARRYPRLPDDMVRDLRPAQRRAVFDAVVAECGVLVRNASLLHRDVHVGNLCVDPADVSRVTLIDFDDALLLREGVSEEARARAEEAQARQLRRLAAELRVDDTV